MSISSIFAGLFPTFTSTNSTNATNKQQIKLLREPQNVAYPPYTIHTEIAALSDPANKGVALNNVILIDGIAPPFSTVWLAYGPLGYFNTVTKADSTGYFLFPATVAPGRTEIRTFAENLGEDYSAINTIQVNLADPIVAWDVIALKAIEGSSLTADESSRVLAILHTAQYDAVAAATDPRSAFAVHATAKPGASPTEAANAAAETVLLALFPGYSSMFTKAFTAATAGDTLTPAILDGAALGTQVANQTLSLHVNDGSTVFNSTGAVVNPDWNQVRPFAIAGASAFRPAPPPAAGTTAFDQALAEVTALGRLDSTTRTADQTAAAQFWDDQVGSVTNPGQWNAIAEQVAIARESGLLADARAFAMLDVALADSAIAAADARAAYPSPRPLSVIPSFDPTWTPLLATPPTPAYVSEHAAFGAAASAILSSAYGKAIHFTTQNDTQPAITRSFASFAAAATEDANSRIYGGVSFRFDTAAGSTLGASVGKAVLARFPKLR